MENSRQSPKFTNINDSNEWNQAYIEKRIPWDQNGATPEFIRLLDEGYFTPDAKILIPGAGNGYDAIEFANRGMEVTAVDFASVPLTNLLATSSRKKLEVQVFQRDFFELASEGYHLSRYDYILEYTFFCAIDPSMRLEYAKAAANILKPVGTFIGLFFPMEKREGGPPFGVSVESVKQSFQPFFDLHWEEPKQSIKPRNGREKLGIFTKKEIAKNS